MILIDNYSQVAAQIETERGISKEELTEAIEQALVSACRRKYSEEALLDAEINPITGEALIWLTREAVKEVSDENLEITLSEAKKIDPKIKEGESVKEEVTPSDFGRLAAQTAKQVIVQRIREAEKNAIYNEFQDKIGSIIIGTVQKIEGRNLLINLGRIEAILPGQEQIPGETYQVKEKIRLYVDDIVKTPKGPLIRISRASTGLLKCLFEIEVPEIQDGIIEIKSISREAGKRSKIAVTSNNASIGAVGTCVGHMGGRIQSIIKEIGNEKIDILEWHEDPKVFIGNSLKPAKISQVIIENEAKKSAIVVVPKDELSLAIGKFGVNVRLAAKLTGWNLDILSEEDYNKKSDEIQQKTHVSIVDRIKQDIQSEKSESTVETSAEEDLKVTELAKELGVKTAELIDQAKTIGITIKSNRSKVSAEDAAALRESQNTGTNT